MTSFTEQSENEAIWIQEVNRLYEHEKAGRNWLRVPAALFISEIDML